MQGKTRWHGLYNGLTTIELLIVLAAVVILLVVLISDFTRIRSQFVLSRGVHRVVQDIRKAQRLALAAVRRYEPSSGVFQTVPGYGIYINLSGDPGVKAYNIYADRDGNKKYSGFPEIFQGVYLGDDYPGLIIKEVNGPPPPGDTLDINFSSKNFVITLSPAMDVAGGSEFAYITLSLENGLDSKTIYIFSSGLIEIE